MAMLAIVLAVSAPSLARFFRGRTLDSEARRFLSLTHYGQSRAISEGVPMSLWIDAPQGTYGLQVETGFTTSDRKAVEYPLAKDLRIEVTAGLAPAGQAGPGVVNRVAIRFLPDGFIAESSPERVVFHEGERAVISIGQSRSRLNYEIQTNNLANAGR